MNLISLAAFRSRQYHSASRPTMRTMRRHVRERKIPGGQVDCNGRYWVDMDAHIQVNHIENRIAQLIGEDPELQAALG